MSAEASRPTRREQRKEETRAELVAAAARVFARSGFHGASLDEVAREAGFTTGAIYWHFGGKDELFLAALEEYVTTRVREYETVRDGVELGALPPRAWADQWMSRLREDPEFLVLILEFTVHAWRHPELRDAFANRMAAGRLAISRILEEQAARAGFELPMPAEQLGTVVRELGTGIGIAKLIDPDGVPDSLLGDFVDMVIGLAVQAQSGEKAR